MAKNGVFHPNFTANSVQANLNTIQIVYGANDPNEPWLTKNIFVIFIRFNPWINIQNKKLSQSCMNNIKHCTMSTRMQHFWKKLMIDMQPFNVGGIP
jgi:hypothetical protein